MGLFSRRRRGGRKMGCGIGRRGRAVRNATQAQRGLHWPYVHTCAMRTYVCEWKDGSGKTETAVTQVPSYLPTQVRIPVCFVGGVLARGGGFPPPVDCVGLFRCYAHPPYPSGCYPWRRHEYCPWEGNWGWCRCRWCVKDVSRLGRVGQRRSCAIFSKQILTSKDGWDGKEDLENGKGVGNCFPFVHAGWPNLE